MADHRFPKAFRAFPLTIATRYGTLPSIVNAADYLLVSKDHGGLIFAREGIEAGPVIATASQSSDFPNVYGSPMARARRLLQLLQFARQNAACLLQTGAKPESDANMESLCAARIFLPRINSPTLGHGLRC